MGGPEMAPQPSPHARKRPGEPVALLDIALRSGPDMAPPRSEAARGTRWSSPMFFCMLDSERR
jgi:hypothetical protein